MYLALKNQAKNTADGVHEALAQDGEQWMNYLDKYSESVQWLMKLTLGFLMNAAQDNLPTALHPDPYQMYSVGGIFCLFLYGGIHIFAPAFFEFQRLEI
jgi:hypothetical protein